MNKTQNTGLYIHIPFCERKCPYCDFYSVVGNFQLQEDYVNAVIKTIDSYKNENLSIDSVYFGGGTPSILDPKLIRKITASIESNLTKDCEITLEANPNTITKEKLIGLKQANINRLSFGMQSANDIERTTLGRRHSNAQVKDVVNLAKEVGFDNISVDLMLATPHQTLSSIDTTLDFINSLDIQHVSAYMLKIEENTAFNRNDIFSLLPNEDDTCDIYLKVCKRLEAMGFNQYEISNFAKGNLQSRHNLKYWLLEPYIGIGPAAHSFYKGDRFFYPRDINAFIDSNGENKIMDENKSDEISDYIMLGLRLVSGIDITTLTDKYNMELSPLLQKISKYERYNLMIKNGSNIHLTPQGFLLSNSIICDFLD